MEKEKDLEKIVEGEETKEEDEYNVDYTWFAIKEKDEDEKKKPLKIESDPIGFYTTKMYSPRRYKVQLFPKHLPYDHLKEKRAFLFC